MTNQGSSVLPPQEKGSFIGGILGFIGLVLYFCLMFSAELLFFATYQYWWVGKLSALVPLKRTAFLVQQGFIIVGGGFVIIAVLYAAYRLLRFVKIRKSMALIIIAFTIIFFIVLTILMPASIMEKIASFTWLPF